MIRLTPRSVAIVIAIVAAAALRFAPHPPNFAPISAMALFSGAYLGRRPIAFAVPLAAMLLADLAIGFYTGIQFIYLSFALIVLLGSVALQRRSALRIGAAAVAGSVLFYLITNFSVWLLYGTYPHTAAGLVACYVAAIPYFQNTLAGDLFYTALLFGGFRLAELWLPRLRAGAVQPA